MEMMDDVEPAVESGRMCTGSSDSLVNESVIAQQKLTYVVSLA